MSELRWFEVDRARLVLEYYHVREAFPDFMLRRIDEQLGWEGVLIERVPKIDAPPLQIRLVYPAAYPIQPPRIVPLAPEIPAERWGHTWHRWGDGRICIVMPAEWEVGDTAADALAKASDWYFNYLAVDHGLMPTMPDVGRAQIGVP